MFEYFSSAVLLVYAVMGLVALYAFVPTILDLWFGRSGVNAATYIMWLANSVVASMYALVVVGDITMLLLSLGWVFCCLTVLSLNWRYQRQTIAVSPEVVPDLTALGERLG